MLLRAIDVALPCTVGIFAGIIGYGRVPDVADVGKERLRVEESDDEGGLGGN
jgi:hypothetical protein